MGEEQEGTHLSKKQRRGGIIFVVVRLEIKRFSERGEERVR